MEFIRTVRHL